MVKSPFLLKFDQLALPCKFKVVCCAPELSTYEQYILNCIEIPYQKLGLDWYWLIFQNSAIPIPNQYQQRFQFKDYFRQHSVLFNK